MEYAALDEEIKNAMRAKDSLRRDILRMVKTEIKSIEVNERREITEADVDAMLKRVIKQTKETLEDSKKGSDQERTDKLAAQVAVLEEYLPQQLSGDALIALIEEKIAELGASSKKDMGKVMGLATKKLAGQADGRTVSTIVKKLLA